MATLCVSCSKNYTEYIKQRSQQVVIIVSNYGEGHHKLPQLSLHCSYLHYIVFNSVESTKLHYFSVHN